MFVDGKLKEINAENRIKMQDIMKIQYTTLTLTAIPTAVHAQMPTLAFFM